MPRNEARRKAWRKAYYQKHKEQSCREARQWSREHGANKRAEMKLTVLSHYGVKGSLRCCWPDCEVTDIDMLSLDHVNNDGSKQRREGQRTGDHLYRSILKDNFPGGFQTLCHNHQWKKELLRRRNK